MHLLILNFIAAWRRICWRMEPLVDFSLLSLPNATQEITLAAWGTHKHPLLSISWMVSYQNISIQPPKTSSSVRKEEKVDVKMTNGGVIRCCQKTWRVNCRSYLLIIDPSPLAREHPLASIIASATFSNTFSFFTFLYVGTVSYSRTWI